MGLVAFVLVILHLAFNLGLLLI